MKEGLYVQTSADPGFTSVSVWESGKGGAKLFTLWINRFSRGNYSVEIENLNPDEVRVRETKRERVVCTTEGA